MSYEEGTTIHRSTIKLLNQLDEYLTQRDQYKVERDTLIDDIAVLRANIRRLERENEKLKIENRRKYYSVNERNKYYRELWDRTEEYRNRAEYAMELSERINCEVLRLEDENERLRNNYNSLTQHIRQKAEANPNEPRYIALVNYMNRLEKGES
ncbi:hypothetical protein BUZ00_03095 [Staphylococcus gallinarum]|uniref:hypothetical protein n=1 Tax=Staphylococcus gallinarum TaxID=1293 RepID=UPI000D1C9BB5|nr:hypothetical protein [Staphylococcus gallinarum]PTE37224.1 hypothetical protein BUZ00_03095 [Staphylococcus gallinarum]